MHLTADVEDLTCDELVRYAHLIAGEAQRRDTQRRRRKLVASQLASIGLHPVTVACLEGAPARVHNSVRLAVMRRDLDPHRWGQL